MATASDRLPVPEALARKIGALSRERLAEVEDFVDFLGQRQREAASDRALRRAAMTASTTSFNAVWNNPDDDVYDDL